jgi:hypothetical protein
LSADRGCHAVSVTDPYGRILGFLDPEMLLFLPSSLSVVLTRLSEPVPDPPLVRKSGSAVNRTRTSGSVAGNSDHYTTNTVQLNNNDDKNHKEIGSE